MTKQEFDFFKQFTDPKIRKTQIQTYALKKVIEKFQRASLFICPGVGKTRIGIIFACENIKKYGGTWLLTVPKENLIKQWKDEAKLWGYEKEFESVVCICHASNNKQHSIIYSGIVVDEIQLSVAGECFGSILDRDFSNTKLLCLTGTKPEDKESLNKLLSVAPLAFEVTVPEAIELNLISNYIINVIDVKLTNEEQIKYNKSQKSFVYNKQLLGNFDAFERAKELLGNKLAPPNDRKAATAFLAAMRNRKSVVQSATNKLSIGEAICKAYPKHHTITFAETNVFTTSFHKKMGERSLLFHSQLKDKDKNEALSQFVDPNYPQNLLCSTRALSEGFNVDGISLAIIFAFSSKANTLIQRIARTLRYIEGKQAIIFMTVVKDTQEEQWAKNALKDLPNVRYFDSWNTYKSLL